MPDQAVLRRLAIVPDGVIKYESQRAALQAYQSGVEVYAALVYASDTHETEDN